MSRQLETAGLMETAGPTRVGLQGALIARNVEVYPRGAIRKRPGYRRWLPLDMGGRVTAVVPLGDKALVISGDVDEQDI